MRARIDITALTNAARRFDAAAEALSRHAHARLTFGAATAGRAHASDGEAVRVAGLRLVDDIGGWALACAGIATALRSTADGYADAEAHATARLS